MGNPRELARLAARNDDHERFGPWWDTRLFLVWVVVNGVAYVVVPLAAYLVDRLASAAPSHVVADHRGLVVLVIASVGALCQGVLVGRWQWRLLVRRVPHLRRRRWVVATLVPAFAVWVLVIAPGAVELLARGGDTLGVFRNGFVQALVLGPLIGMSQALALRPQTTRWAWWLAANVVTYLTGAALYPLGCWLQQALNLAAVVPGYFPVVAFTIHGVWMLWITAPSATGEATTNRKAAVLPTN